MLENCAMQHIGIIGWQEDTARHGLTSSQGAVMSRHQARFTVPTPLCIRNPRLLYRLTQPDWALASVEQVCSQNPIPSCCDATSHGCVYRTLKRTEAMDESNKQTQAATLKPSLCASHPASHAHRRVVAQSTTLTAASAAITAAAACQQTRSGCSRRKHSLRASTLRLPGRATSHAVPCAAAGMAAANHTTQQRHCRYHTRLRSSCSRQKAVTCAHAVHLPF